MPFCGTFIQLSHPKEEFWTARNRACLQFLFLFSGHQNKNHSAQTWLKKGLQPSCLSWIVLILMSRKQKRKRLPKIRILDETIEERCARAVSRKTPIYFILEIKWKSITSTLVLLHWSLTLECSSGLVGLYNVTSNCIRSIYNCEVYLGEAIHHFPQFIVREIVQSRSFTPFLPWKKPQLIKVFNNLMNVCKKNPWKKKQIKNDT